MVLRWGTAVVAALVTALVLGGAVTAAAEPSRRSVVASFYPVAYAASASAVTASR